MSLKAVNYYHNVLHLGYCSSPTSTSVFGTDQGNDSDMIFVQELLKSISKILKSEGINYGRFEPLTNPGRSLT